MMNGDGVQPIGESDVRLNVREENGEKETPRVSKKGKLV
jgi:hypothetical protein